MNKENQKKNSERFMARGDETIIKRLKPFDYINFVDWKNAEEQHFH